MQEGEVVDATFMSVAALREFLAAQIQRAKDDDADVHQLPDRDPGDGTLTVRQRKVLDVIRNSVDRRGYPPSMREIGQAVGLSSTSSVAHQLMALERKGFLRRDPHRPRAYEVRAADA